MTARHQWSKDDEIVVLHAYFCGALGDVAVQRRARDAIDPGMPTASVRRKLLGFRILNRLDNESVGAAGGPSRLSREAWEKYCLDDGAMLHKLRDGGPHADFAGACRDFATLDSDARRIIKRRAAPARRIVRRETLGVFYAALAQGIPPADALKQMRDAAESQEKRLLLYDSLASDVANAASVHDIAGLLDKASGRSSAGISAVERAVLHLAVAEMLAHPARGRAIIIDEAVEIAKEYGSEGGHKIVNAVLDRAATLLTESPLGNGMVRDKQKNNGPARRKKDN